MSCNRADYPLPANLSAENLILSATLSDSEVFPRIADDLKAEDFSTEQHQRIFRRMKDLFDRGDPLGYGTLAHELEKYGELQSVGGASYLVSLDAPRIADLDGLVKIVREKSSLRKTIRLCQLLEERCYAAGESPGDLLVVAERFNEILSPAEARRQKARNVEKIIADAGGLNVFGAPEKKPGIALPFPTISKSLGGFRPGTLNVLGARTSVGKSAFNTQVGERAAADGYYVLLVTLEMPAPGLLHRSIAGRAGVNAYRYRQGNLTPTERTSVLAEINTLIEFGDRLQIVDSDITVAGIAALLRSLASRGTRIDLLTIDYLQLLSSLNRTENRVQEVAALSRGLKKLAIEFQIAVLALSQLIRQPAIEEPQLHWLKESGSIEQDADSVIFLWLKKEPEEGDAVREVLWKIAKNRDGMLNRGALTFYPKYCRFKESDDEKGAAA